MFSGHLLLLRINAQSRSSNLLSLDNIDNEDNFGENQQVNTRYPLRAFPELPMIIKLRNGERKHEKCERDLFDKHFVRI